MGVDQLAQEQDLISGSTALLPPMLSQRSWASVLLLFSIIPAYAKSGVIRSRDLNAEQAWMSRMLSFA